MSKITLDLVVDSTWSDGFGCTLTISNHNDFAIESYSLIMKSPQTHVSWSGDLIFEEEAPGSVAIRQQSWLGPLVANSSLVQTFGGTGLPPSLSAFAFNQIDPPIIPVDQNVRGTFPIRSYAPYVDVLAWPTFDLIALAKSTGHLFYDLAFVVSDAAGKPSWGGVVGMSDRHFIPQVTELRAIGGDVIVSFGGANGLELAQTAKSLPDLVAAYQSVIDAYGLRWVDFDIEGSAVADKKSVDLRNRAITVLQKNNPGLRVSYCLPVIPSGLTHDGVIVLRNALQNGTKVDVLGLMTMDFGDSAFNSKTQTMAQACSECVRNVWIQLQYLKMTTTTALRIIPMIGVNDVTSEVFSLEDAKALLTFARATPYVNGLSGWSVNRDVAGTAKSYADGSSSSISQPDHAFLDIFKTFN